MVRDFAGSHHGFLVGESNLLPGRHRRVGRFQTAQTDNGRYHKIYVWQGGGTDGACGAVNHLSAAQAGSLEAG